MNERIKLLAEQASFKNQDEESITYFAELIVRECAKTIESQDVDPSFKNRMSWAIKTKFGIEE